MVERFDEMPQTLHAVVSDEFLTTSNGGRVKLSRPVRHITELHLLGQRTGITHFWIMPNSYVAGLGHEFLADRDGYNIFQTKNSNGSLFESPQSARCRKLQSASHEILACYPDKAFGWVVNDETDILCTIDYLADVLKVPVQWSPIHMGHTLLRNSVTRENWLVESTIPLHTLPFNKAAKDIHFVRPLTLDLVGQWWHEYDRNSHYLAGCAGVMVGTGTPIHLKENELYSGGYVSGSVETGVYRVEVKDASKWPVYLPPIIRGEWVGGDVLEYAIQQGYEVIAREAWVFPESHQLLRQWATNLWNSRTTLNPKSESVYFPHLQARINAYNTIKRVATKSVGSFAIRHEKHNLARNNWWEEAVNKSRVVMLYHLKKFADAGYFPYGVWCDAASYVSPNSNPVEAVPGIMLRSDKLGGFKHAWSLQLTQEIIEESFKYEGYSMLSFLKEKAGVKDAQ
jgi:hypothetical protein